MGSKGGGGQGRSALWAYDMALRSGERKRMAGVDEAGRGPLAGPVVAAAVILAEGSPLEGLNDSKKLSPSVRQRLYHEIQASSVAWGIGVASAREIDEINILQATRRAMARAVKCLKVQPDCLLIDGTIPLILTPPSATWAANRSAEITPPSATWDANRTAEITPPSASRAANRTAEEVSPRQILIVGGDGLSASIAAASILAKVARDRMMVALHRKFPQYNFFRNKGYGTREHLQALERYGPSPWHRRSFRPVRK